MGKIHLSNSKEFEFYNALHHINKMKDKNYVIISIDAEKTFDITQHLFMIKTFSKVGMGEHASA